MSMTKRRDEGGIIFSRGQPPYAPYYNESGRCGSMDGDFVTPATNPAVGEEAGVALSWPPHV